MDVKTESAIDRLIGLQYRRDKLLDEAILGWCLTNLGSDKANELIGIVRDSRSGERSELKKDVIAMVKSLTSAA